MLESYSVGVAIETIDMQEIKHSSMNKSLAYLASRLSEAKSNPKRAVEYLSESLYGKAKLKILGNYLKPNNELITEKDWNILVILDACRYDAFSRVDGLPAEPDRYLSQASATFPWFMKNFGNRNKNETDDIVYISANPKASTENIKEEKLHHIEEVFRYGWDTSINSVPPEVVTDAALDTFEEYPQSRAVVHYIQPHGPFVGTDNPELSHDQYQSLRKGKVSRDIVETTYDECLSHVAEEVSRLIKYSSREITITADHGEAFGENGVYAHPPWAHMKELLEVPWVTVDPGEKDRPTDNKHTRRTSADVSVQDQLNHLGYK